MNNLTKYALLLIFLANSSLVFAEGEKKWEIEAKGEIRDLLTSPDNSVYFVADNVYAVTNLGREKWVSYIDHNLRVVDIALSPKNILFGSSNKGILKFTPTGKYSFIYPTSLGLAHIAIDSESTIYGSGTDHPDFFAIDENGKEKWVDGFGFTTEPAIDTLGTLYINDSELDWGFLSVNHIDGKENWSFVRKEKDKNRNEIRALWCRPALIDTNNIIYVACHHENIDRYNSKTGLYFLKNTELYALLPNKDKKWSLKTKYAMITSALSSDGTIYAISWQDYAGNLQKDYLFAFTSEGKQKWSLKIKEVSYPVIDAQGNLYVGSSDGKLYAVTPEGKEKWAVNAGGKAKHLALSPDSQTLYAAVGNKLIAYNTDVNGAPQWAMYRHDAQRTGRASPVKSSSSNPSATFGWGNAPDQFGLQKGEEIETFGPHTFSLDSQGNMYVVDTINKNIKVLNNEGKFVKNIDFEGWASDIFVDGKKNIITFNNDSFSIYDANSQRKTFALSDVIPKIEGYGQGIWEDKQGNLYICKLQNCYQITNNNKVLSPNEQADSVVPGYPLTKNRYVRTEWKDEHNAIALILNEDWEIIQEIKMKTDDVFGAINFIQQDTDGNFYFEVEKITDDNYVHLDVEQYDEKGNRLSAQEYPNDYFSTVYKKIFVDKTGQVGRLFTTPKGVDAVAKQNNPVTPVVNAQQNGDCAKDRYRIVKSITKYGDNIKNVVNSSTVEYKYNPKYLGYKSDYFKFNFIFLEGINSIASYDFSLTFLDSSSDCHFSGLVQAIKTYDGSSDNSTDDFIYENSKLIKINATNISHDHYINFKYKNNKIIQCVDNQIKYTSTLQQRDRYTNVFYNSKGQPIRVTSSPDNSSMNYVYDGNKIIRKKEYDIGDVKRQDVALLTHSKNIFMLEKFSEFKNGKIEANGNNKFVRYYDNNDRLIKVINNYSSPEVGEGFTITEYTWEEIK